MRAYELTTNVWAMRRTVVLLRGINVGGRNVVPMAALRTSLTKAGFANVATYIQSGNIAVDSTLMADDIAAAVEDELADVFDVQVPAVAVKQDDIASIIESAPFASESDPAFQLIYFAKAPVDVAGVDGMDRSRWPGDVITGAPNAVYVSYGSGQSTSKLTVDQLERAAGTTLTGRNLRSAAKLTTL